MEAGPASSGGGARSLGAEQAAAEGAAARVAVEGAVGDGELVPRPDARRADSDYGPAAGEGQREAGGAARVVQQARDLAGWGGT